MYKSQYSLQRFLYFEGHGADYINDFILIIRFLIYVVLLKHVFKMLFIFLFLKLQKYRKF